MTSDSRRISGLPVGPAITAVLICSLASSPAVAQSPILLHDVTPQTGITFRHTDGSCGRRYIVETVSAGLALFDCDQDGDIDIYFLNGAPLPGADVDRTPTNALYRNEGAWKFKDVTRQAGVGDPKYGLGVAAADYDNDGDQDVYVNNFGPNVLYRNNGNGTFSDVTTEAGVGNDDRVGAGVSFLDIDKDSLLDLYVSNYLVFSYELHRPHSMLGIPTYRGPNDYSPDPDTLYRNRGDGTFADVSVSSGVAAHAGTGMGIVSADYDNDGDTDVFVNNDVHANFLFQNDGKGNFDEVALISGTAFDYSGAAQGSMGVDCGDYDNDGWLDFYQTSYQKQMPVLYKNTGLGFFEDVTLQSRAGILAFPHVNWGTGFVDFDNDGDRDIFLACGHLMDNIELRDDTTSYMARNRLLLNAGNGQFVDVTDTSGDGLDVKLSSRGAGFDDLDKDGDIDVVILNSRREPTILRNDSANDHHWLQIQLQGVNANRDGVGARVKVVAGDLTQIDEVHSGRGYQSHHGSCLHFGLGRRDRVDRVEVRWMGGGVDVFDNVGVDRLVKLKEGTSKGRGSENVQE